MKVLFLFKFWLRLTLLCVLFYFVHSYTVQFSGNFSEESLLFHAYIANYGLAIFIFGGLCLLR
ncbi:MAG: hypothetical protein ACPH2K_04055, partial [Flavicella sp.]